MITAMINNISAPYIYQSGNIFAIDLFWAFKTFFLFSFWGRRIWKYALSPKCYFTDIISFYYRQE